MQGRAQIMLWSEVERGACLRDLKMSLQFTNKWSNLECSRVLKVTIFNNPRRVKLWVLARLKSPPTMNRLLERRWDVEVIKVSKKGVRVCIKQIHPSRHRNKNFFQQSPSGIYINRYNLTWTSYFALQSSYHAFIEVTLTSFQFVLNKFILRDIAHNNDFQQSRSGLFINSYNLAWTSYFALQSSYHAFIEVTFTSLTFVLNKFNLRDIAHNNFFQQSPSGLFINSYNLAWTSYFAPQSSCNAFIEVTLTSLQFVLNKFILRDIAHEMFYQQ